MSDEPPERDVTPLLTTEERKAVLSARSMTPLTLLMVVETVKAEARREGAAEVTGRVETALAQIESRFETEFHSDADVARDNAYRYAYRTVRAALRGDAPKPD